MGFRFRRSIRLFPGVRLNVGTRGVSASVGTRGAHVTVGRTGVHTTVGIPGTGVSYTTFRPVRRPLSRTPRATSRIRSWKASPLGTPAISPRTYWLLGWLAATVACGGLLVSYFPSINGDAAFAISAPAVAVAIWAAHRIAGTIRRSAVTRADQQAQLDAERRYTEQTGFPVVHRPGDAQVQPGS
jgi:hypothetical protein